MASAGYYRFPTLHEDTVVFTSEDDLWSVSASGGIARRLTANLGAISRPAFSPDGSALAFTGREEGPPEVYVMAAAGGPVRRVTYLGSNTAVLGWAPDGASVLFSSDAGQPFEGTGVIHEVTADGGEPVRWSIGPAMSLSIDGNRRIAIGRNAVDPARWKRYRGGTAGEIWVDADGGGQFRKLIDLPGNMARPMWIGDRVYFISDHEGFGNLYSCTPDGGDLQRHTHRSDYYVRFPSSDGRRVAYHAGADLYVYNPATGGESRVDVAYHSPRVQRQRRFVDPARYLESYYPHPEGHSVAANVRGKSFAMGNWEGPVRQQGGEPAPVRYRLTRWLNDGKRMIAVSDAGGEEALEIHYGADGREPERIADLDIGHPYAIRVSPTADHLLLSNHRNELLFVDLSEKALQVVDRSEFGSVRGFDWSPDGRWAAYGFPTSHYTTCIKLWDRTTGDLHQATEPILHDVAPAFDPEGKYLYFLGLRDLNPVYDNLHFDLGFPRGMRPFLLTLRADLLSPFTPTPHPLAADAKPEPKPEDGKQDQDEPKPVADDDQPAGETPEPRKPKSAPVVIDLPGIARRVVAFPVPEGRYGQIAGIKGKALFTSFPVEGALQQDARPGEPGGRGTLEVYDFEAQKHEALLGGLSDFQIALDGKTMYYRSGSRLRAVKAGAKPDDKGDQPGRRTGWMDLGRVRVSVEPGIEWQQMAREAWRLQREYFWTPDMSQIDWAGVWDRYAPLIDRVGTRGEFSDLMWEMQGELGTSHAYEMGGDYRPEPAYPQGFLGAELVWDEEAGAYRVRHVVQGAAGEPRADSPLSAPGVLVQPGSLICAINGRALSRDLRPQELLVYQADTEVAITVEDADRKRRDVTVKTLRSEFPARYREWVEANRRRVHEATGGRVGYVHIPDMGARGYAEFHRLYLAEVAYDGMVVDVRFNRGGHVSQLLIEKLARRRVGYDVSRWGQPEPYPAFSVAGPMVALTNQWAGSDGDIFSHVFKLLKLGPLIGKRTWGGVIGISPRNVLADGSITTQPEFSFWFTDVGWGVENYGTDPDIEVDVAPQDYAAGLDPQLDRAIEVVLQRLETEPPLKPDFSMRPNLSPPPFAAPSEE